MPPRPVIDPASADLEPDLDDLRSLWLAAMYERAFERFVGESAKRFLDPPEEATLAPLRPENADHERRILDRADAIVQRLPGHHAEALAHVALLDILEVERAAREFYVSHVPRLHDPELVALFRELAREEARHVRLAEDALLAFEARTDRHHKRPPRRGIPGVGDEATPLWEGVTDLGRSTIHGRPDRR